VVLEVLVVLLARRPWSIGDLLRESGKSALALP